MKASILFAGIRSVCQVLKKLGYEVVSIDNGSRFMKRKKIGSLGTIISDIMTWDYKKYKCFDLILASTPCKFYSCLSKCFRLKEYHEPSYVKGDVFFKRTLEIIEHFNPNDGS